MTRNQLTTSERVELAAYRELFAEINRVTHHLNDGDLEQRWNTTPNAATLPNADTLRAQFNHFLDMVDVYLRESDGALAAAMSNRFERRFLHTGMRGAFARQATRVDTTTRELADAHTQLTASTHARTALAAHFEQEVLTHAENLSTVANELQTVSSHLSQDTRDVAERIGATAAQADNLTQHSEAMRDINSPSNKSQNKHDYSPSTPPLNPNVWENKAQGSLLWLTKSVNSRTKQVRRPTVSRNASLNHANKSHPLPGH